LGDVAIDIVRKKWWTKRNGNRPQRNDSANNDDGATRISDTASAINKAKPTKTEKDQAEKEPHGRLRAGSRLSDSRYRQSPTWNGQAPPWRRRRNYRGSYNSAQCTEDGLPPTRASSSFRLPMGLVSLLAKFFIRRTKEDGPAALCEAA
jgi:hypothetical protein